MGSGLGVLQGRSSSWVEDTVLMRVWLWIGTVPLLSIPILIYAGIGPDVRLVQVFLAL